MSKYSEKVHVEVPCATAHCEEQGTKLAAVAGRPYWFCEAHYARHQREQR